MSVNLDKNQKELTKKLEELGLTSKEAEVYIALIKLGEVTSGAIIETTGLHRQYVYQSLAKLEERGLVQHVVKSGWKRFSAKSPKLFERLIVRQQKIAAEVVDEMQKLYALPAHHEFEVFQGKESFAAHEFDLLAGAPTKSALLVVGGEGDQFLNTLGGKIADYEKLRVEKNVSVRYIGSMNQLDYLKRSKNERKLFDFRILPGLFTGAVNTNILPGAIWFNIFGEPAFSFEVSNPVIAGSYAQFFETLWRLGKE